jgi:hypothetical protein
MQSHDQRAIKNGIQAAYEYLRSHPSTSIQYVKKVRYELSRHLGNRDPLVTPWIYSLIAALGDEQYEPYLRSQLKNYEFDPVNRTWAIASLARVSADYQQVLNSIDEDHALSYQLAAAMYQGNVNDARAVRLASDADDRLAHLWIALLFSEGRADIPISQVKELTGSRDAEVAQYALFALHRHPRTGIESVTIGPQDLMNLQPRVRRWYYQLLIKDPSNLVIYGSQIREWMASETHTHAREGLAKAFIGLRTPAAWIHDLRTWAESENDPYVLDVLSQISVINDIIKARQLDEKDHATAAAYTSSRLGSAVDLPTRREVPMQVRRGLITISVAKGMTYMDMRNQSVTVSGNDNTIGSVQGAYSTAETKQVVSRGDVSQDSARVIELLTSIAVALRQQDNGGEGAELLELAAHDIEEDSTAATSGDSKKMARLKARFRQASLALGSVAAVTADTNELISEAQKLIHVLT